VRLVQPALNAPYSVELLVNGLVPCYADNDDTAAEANSLEKAKDDIGYDDISDDELDDLIEAAEDEQDENPAESIGRLLFPSFSRRS